MSSNQYQSPLPHTGGDRPLITIVGLGPAGPDLVTVQAAELLRSTAVVRLRTNLHPAAAIAPDAATFDHLYQGAATIESVYPAIVEALVELAQQEGHVVYAVPGSPLVAEETVDRLRSDDRVDVDIVPALSFLDVTWARLGVDPLATGPRLVDGRRFAIEAAGERGPLLVAQCDAPWVLSDIKLAFEGVAPPTVTVLQRLGAVDEHIETIAWEDLDRVVEPDPLTSLWIPEVHAPVASELVRLDEVARRLRQECPWDREQTHASLAPHLIEEAYELLDAIAAVERATTAADQADPGIAAPQAEDQLAVAEAELVEELGDVLFQVFAHAAVAADEGRFNIADIAQGITDKLIERHPHVYGDEKAETADDVMTTWESNKKASKGRASLMDGIPSSLPALLYAQKVLKKMATANVTIDDRDLVGTGIGGALMLMVIEARQQGVDAEGALREVASALRTRFESAERLAAGGGIELSTATSEIADSYWEQAGRP